MGSNFKNNLIAADAACRSQAGVHAAIFIAGEDDRRGIGCDAVDVAAVIGKAAAVEDECGCPVIIAALGECRPAAERENAVFIDIQIAVIGKRSSAADGQRRRDMELHGPRNYNVPCQGNISAECRRIGRIGVEIAGIRVCNRKIGIEFICRRRVRIEVDLLCNQ